MFKVNVATDSVNFDAIIDGETGKFRYNIADNSYTPENIVYVDNITQAAGSYTVDNMLVRNSHSRGFLIKTRDVEIKHCTFDRVSLSGIYMRPEMHWGESSMAKNVTVKQCLFDNTGFLHNGITNHEQACIRVEGTSSIVSDNTLPIENIEITGCKFTGNEQRYAIFVNSAKNVLIKDNVFDPIVCDQLPDVCGTAVLIDTCMNVEISNNSYNYEHYTGDVRQVITGKNYKNVFGKDVTDESGNSLLPDNVN